MPHELPQPSAYDYWRQHCDGVPRARALDSPATYPSRWFAHLAQSPLKELAVLAIAALWSAFVHATPTLDTTPASLLSSLTGMAMQGSDSHATQSGGIFEELDALVPFESNVDRPGFDSIDLGCRSAGRRCAIDSTSVDSGHQSLEAKISATRIGADTFTFSAADSAARRGAIVRYAWDFGDGNSAAGVMPSHRFPAVGNYKVTLTVTDVASASKAIALVNAYDVAALSAPTATATSTLPLSADFIPLGNDPRGGSNGFNTMKRLPDGRGIIFGGFSHDSTGSNAVMVFDPVTKSAKIVVPNTPVGWSQSFPGTMDDRGKTFLENRDNHLTFVVGNELWVTSGERAGSFLGNWSGRLNQTTWKWSIDDDNKKFGSLPAFPRWENSAAGTIEATGVVYILAGERANNPWDGLHVLYPDGSSKEWINLWGVPAFTGSQRLRSVNNSHWVRNGKISVYGGTHLMFTNVSEPGHTLYEVDVPALGSSATPKMSVVSVNSLPDGQRVEGPFVFAYYVPARDLMVATNGTLVNIYDYATNKWANVPVRTPPGAPPENRHYGAGFYSPEVDLGIVLYQNPIYGLRLNYTANPPPVSTPSPPPPPPKPAPNPKPTPSPTPTPPPPPPVSSPPTKTSTPATPTPTPPPISGHLSVTVTAVPYSGVGKVLGNSKHLGFARIGNRWYKAFGDHAPTDRPIISDDMIVQGGQQEIYSFNVPANDWREDFPYYDPNPAHVQEAFPDDGFIIERKGEIWAFSGATNHKNTPPFTPPGYATQVWGRMMAWTPGGYWRDVAPMIGDMMSNRAWGGMYDPALDRFIVPSWRNYLVWTVFSGVDGSDQTKRTSAGVAYQFGNHDFHVAGMVADLANRKGYVYDHTKGELWQVDLDSIPAAPTMRMVVTLPEPPQAAEGVAKLAWHPDLRAVIVVATKLHAYQPDTNQTTSWPRPDGFINGVGHYVPASTIFYDPDTHDIVSIGGIDWDTSIISPVYWRLSIH